MNRAQLKQMENELQKRLTEDYSPEEIADFATRALSASLSMLDETLDENEQLRKQAQKHAA